MRKISKEASDALMNRKEWKSGNTRVTVCDGRATMSLFDNAIAKYDGATLKVSFAGWPTKTTCDRLNALTGVDASIKGGDPVVNGSRVFDVEWVTIGSVIC